MPGDTVSSGISSCARTPRHWRPPRRRELRHRPGRLRPRPPRSCSRRPRRRRSEGGAGGFVGEYRDRVGVDPDPAQPVDVRATGVVVPDCPEHHHVGAGSRGGHRLVGTLAAGEALGAPARGRLTRLRMPIDVRDQVDVHRPQHQHASHQEVPVPEPSPCPAHQPGVANAPSTSSATSRLAGAWPCGSWARLPSQSRRSTMVRPRDQVPASATRTGSRSVVRPSRARRRHTPRRRRRSSRSRRLNRSHWKAIRRPASPAGPLGCVSPPGHCPRRAPRADRRRRRARTSPSRCRSAQASRA